MKNDRNRQCKNCLVSFASGFGLKPKSDGVETCCLYPNNTGYDKLRGTYERCVDIQMLNKCKFEYRKYKLKHR